MEADDIDFFVIFLYKIKNIQTMIAERDGILKKSFGCVYFNFPPLMRRLYNVSIPLSGFLACNSFR